MSAAEARRAAVGLIRRGVAPIPVPAGQKNPGRAGWESMRISEDEVAHHWPNGQNVGVLCGKPSGGLVDVDLDSQEAAAVAGQFLASTLTSGRESRPHTHWWFLSTGAASRDWKAPDGTKLVELRSTGRQTLVEPSTHPDGDRYLWHREAGLEAAEVGAAELGEALNSLATAALLARNLPPARAEGGGGRHDYALALAGFLLRPGHLDRDATEKILKAAWDAKGWTDEGSRRSAHRDIEGVVRDTAARLEAGESVVGGPTLEESAPGVVKQVCKWWGWDERGPVASGEENERPTQAQLLLGCVGSVDLFHTSAGETYATVPIGGHQETHPIKSKGFRRWLVRGYYEAQGRPPGAQALQDVLGLLEARAQFDGPEREVHVRVAEHDGRIYLDLANASWEAVEIAPSGWRVVSAEAVPVRFRRPRGMLPLPTPASGGHERDRRDDGDDALRGFLNLDVDGDGDYRLIVAWLVQALRPTGPYPVLNLQGEQGSAKSTAEKMLRSLVDPSTAPIRTTPRNERDLIISATNSWCVAFDNISNLQPWLSDALCRLATGGGFTARELYADAEEVLFEATRPVILNGITDVATRPDLLDRALVVTLPPIPEEKRRPEADLWRDFEAARPRILAHLLDGAAGALRSVGNVRLDGMPRMADFAVWATAAEAALGWEPGAFMAAYAGNRAEAAEGALEADPVAAAVFAFMGTRHDWTGTSTDLWQALNGATDEDVRRTKAWPGAPNALTARLKRLAPALRDAGVEYGETREPGGHRRRIKYLEKRADARDRPGRPDCPGGAETSSNRRVGGGTPPAEAGRPRDEAGPKIVPDRTPADSQARDAWDARDGDPRQHPVGVNPEDVRGLFARPPDWLRNQEMKCRQEGAPARLVKALAASVAAHLVGDSTRGGEVLPAVEERFHQLDRGCEARL